MAMEKEGCKTKDAQDRIWMMDSKGLVTTDRKEMDKNKAKFAKKAEPLKNLEQIIDLVQPTALIGKLQILHIHATTKKEKNLFDEKKEEKLSQAKFRSFLSLNQ